MHPRLVFVLGVALIGPSLGGCSTIDRLAQLGEPPPLTAIEDPTTTAGYKPVQMPMPTPQPASYSPNSLWRNGSRAFFKDQRAHQVGDILTIMVNLNDKAVIANETQRSRENKEDSGVDNFFGKPKVPIMNTPVPTRIFTGDSSSSSEGKGSVKHQDRAGPHRLWRPRPDHRCATAALRPAVPRRVAAVLASASVVLRRSMMASGKVGRPGRHHAPQLQSSPAAPSRERFSGQRGLRMLPPEAAYLWWDTK
jgi:hypothetical protein